MENWFQKVNIYSEFNSVGSGDGEPTSITVSEMEEMQKQICEYRSLVEAKTEQNATLRSVLKANKMAAEKALGNLKAKYDSEKTIISETMLKLRNELRLLKEDAATFSSMSHFCTYFSNV